MKNKLYLLTVTAFFSVTIAAANGPALRIMVSEPKNELGLDLTLLMSHLFGWNNNYLVYDSYSGGYYNPAGDYLITYKRYFGNNAIRFGLGGYINNTSSKDDAGTFSSSSDVSAFSFRAGYQRNFYVTNYFTWYAGADLKVNTTASNYKNDYFVTPNDYNSESNGMFYGGGPLVGISWIIRPRLKLSTEASLDFISGSNKTSLTYEDPAQPDANYTTNTTSFQPVYPVNLFFEFKF